MFNSFGGVDGATPAREPEPEPDPVPALALRPYRTKQQQKVTGAAMATRYRQEDKPSIQGVADEFGVSYGTAYRLMKAANVVFRSRGGPRARGSRTAVN